MTIPFKLPPPARLPRDLEVPRAVSHAPKRTYPTADEADDDATLLWKPSPRSSIRRGRAIATTKVRPFAFKGGNSEDDLTLIKKPNLADVRLLRSDRPPARAAVAFALGEEPPVPCALLALLPSPPQREVTPLPAPPLAQAVATVMPLPSLGHAASAEPAAIEAPALPAASDWDEIPYVPELPQRSRFAPQHALWGAAVCLAALGAVVAVLANPEQSAVLVEQAVARGWTLFALTR